MKQIFPNGLVLVWSYNGYGWTFIERYSSGKVRYSFVPRSL